MSFNGFGKNSGPSGTPLQNPFYNLHRPPSTSTHVPRPSSASHLAWGDLKPSPFKNYDATPYQSPPIGLLPRVASSNPRTEFTVNTAQIQDSTMISGPIIPSSNQGYSAPYRARSPPLGFQNNVYVRAQHPQSQVQPPNSTQSKISKGDNISLHQEDRFSSFSTNGGNYQSQKMRSPTLPSLRGASPEYGFLASGGQKRSAIDYSDLDAPDETPTPTLNFESRFSTWDSSRPSIGNQKPFSSSPPMWGNTLQQAGMPLISKTVQISHADVIPPKRTRSPTPPPNRDSSPSFVSDVYKRAPSPSHIESSQKPLPFPVVKKAKLPALSSSGQENSNSAQEMERELNAKVKRLARFKDELSQPDPSNSTIRDQKSPIKSRQIISEDQTTDDLGDEGLASSSSIVGVCPDMCPESERGERERKGDLDHYERLDGDRNMTSEFLAVKKYTRTAERSSKLIRPIPILQKTMDYLLNLLDRPYDDRLLGLYNFLWDRMRAIRMDLRMQHIFNLKSISMLEQMIRLHILAMHELCEYTKGEGFSEGFDAHLNIEQMNKTSVELFQLYDDHRKKGINVPSEREFRGYYALLKLDKHPGYKVEPSELSIDLAKMTPEMRQTQQVLFARDVARACRTGNFIAFFRLARKASYLQACLMHAHFSKLRTHALASLNCGLQMNQGIPVPQVAKWLGMEEEDIETLLEYYDFSVKDFKEPYMVKENTLINVDNDYPVKRSKLVAKKQSKMIVNDVSSPSLAESYDATKELSKFEPKRDPVKKPSPVQFIVPESTTRASDQEMCDSDTSLLLSPVGKVSEPSIGLTSSDEKQSIYESQVVPASNSLFGNIKKSNYDSVLRNPFVRNIEHDLEVTPAPIMLERVEEKVLFVQQVDSVVNTPIPEMTSVEDFEDEEQIGVMEEDEADDGEMDYYDQEVAEAKLKLILRIWKRCAAKKKQLREHKKSEANAALNSLSLGPTIRQSQTQPGTYGTFNIDHTTSKRREIQERSLSVLNPSKVAANKLFGKNPDAKCLCWKMVLFSQEETKIGSWLHSKLMPANNKSEGDLLVSSPGLVIWKSYIDMICCFSVIKSITTFHDIDNALMGASSILFLLSESTPLQIQKNSLHSLVMSIPSGSCLPLLVLSESSKNPSTIAQDLELYQIDKSRVRAYSISFLKDQTTQNLDGFFSDASLREALEWLASESPQQIAIKAVKTRELVISHLSSDMLDEMKGYRNVGPNHCISAINKALDQSIEAISTAANSNPISWPCPEIDLLDKFSDEYRTVAWFLLSRGWSKSSRIQTLLSTLNDTKLPTWDYDISWLLRGCNTGDDIENHKSRLENYLKMYLTEKIQMMGEALAKKEASILLQKCAHLELHNSTYYIRPSWLRIFRRVFSWRLMNMTDGEVSSAHVLARHDFSAPISESESNVFLPSYVDHPFLDELVDVGCNSIDLVSTQRENQDFRPLASDKENINDDMDNHILVTSCDNTRPAEQDDAGIDVISSSKPSSKEADRLSELLDMCSIVQNKIDKKLSIYF